MKCPEFSNNISDCGQGEKLFFLWLTENDTGNIIKQKEGF